MCTAFELLTARYLVRVQVEELYYLKWDFSKSPLIIVILYEFRN
jgi:hypothetical protein